MAWSPKQRRYLDLCLRSLAQLDYPPELLEVIVVAPPSYLSELPPSEGNVRFLDPGLGEHFMASAGYNVGYAAASPDSKYILTLNDDVALTRSSLRKLVTTAESLSTPLSAVNATSPCDRGLTCFLDFAVLKDGTRYVLQEQNYRIEDCEHILPEMLTAESQYPWGLIMQPHLCMYATLISRALYEKIGGFDEGFLGGPDDIDFSWRATEAGAILMMDLSAVIWHFGSVTITSSYPPRRWLRNIDYFRSKWGKLPPFVTPSHYEANRKAAEVNHAE